MDATAATILVVEDNEMNRMLLRDILTFNGYGVLEATDVSSGAASLRDPRVRLVLLDIQLPGGGGEVLLRAIRADQRTAHLPVVAVTALAMSGDRERFLDAGFDGYVSKPIDLKTLTREIARHVGEGSHT